MGEVDSGLAANLRVLCSYKSSISEVCRDLGINRSQFNRYLSGASSPRPALLRKLCDYFGLETHEALLPPDEFEALIRVRGVAAPRQGRWLEDSLEQILQSSSKSALELEGRFFEYHLSMAVPGSILRSLMVFAPRDGVMTYRRLERAGAPGVVCRRHFRYQGVALTLGERLFLIDHEHELNLEISQTILYPDYASRPRTLTGVKLGAAARQQRAPCGTRVYLERVPEGSSWVGNLRACGLFSGESTQISAEIRTAIDNRSSGPHHFMAYVPGGQLHA